jgi:hypothetical protein
MLADEKRKLKVAQQLKAGEAEKVVATRLRALKGDLDKELASATRERDALNAGWRDQCLQRPRSARPRRAGIGEGHPKSRQQEGVRTGARGNSQRDRLGLEEACRAGYSAEVAVERRVRMRVSGSGFDGQGGLESARLFAGT